MAFKDLENKFKDVKGKLEEEHRKAVEQSIAESIDIVSDSE
ncbi:MAG: hypothetical protein ACYDEQ_04955 [Desulfocucumaceae bacterium]